MGPSTGCDHVTRGRRARFLRSSCCTKVLLDGTAVQGRNRKAGSPAIRPGTPGDQEEPDWRRGRGRRSREVITPTSHHGPDGHWAWDQPHRSMMRGGSTIIYSHIGDTAYPPLDPHGISGDCLEGASPPKPDRPEWDADNGPGTRPEERPQGEMLAPDGVAPTRGNASCRYSHERKALPGEGRNRREKGVKRGSGEKTRRDTGSDDQL